MEKDYASKVLGSRGRAEMGWVDFRRDTACKKKESRLQGWSQHFIKRQGSDICTATT